MSHVCTLLKNENGHRADACFVLKNAPHRLHLAKNVTFWNKRALCVARTGAFDDTKRIIDAADRNRTLRRSSALCPKARPDTKCMSMQCGNVRFRPRISRLYTSRTFRENLKRMKLFIAEWSSFARVAILRSKSFRVIGNSSRYTEVFLLGRRKLKVKSYAYIHMLQNKKIIDCCFYIKSPINPKNRAHIQNMNDAEYFGYIKYTYIQRFYKTIELIIFNV